MLGVGLEKEQERLHMMSKGRGITIRIYITFLCAALVNVILAFAKVDYALASRAIDTTCMPLVRRIEGSFDSITVIVPIVLTFFTVPTLRALFDAEREEAAADEAPKPKQN